MNLILFFEQDYIKPRTIRLNDRRLEYIRKVIRSQKGDCLCVGLNDGKIGQGVITELNKDFVEIEVRLKKKPPAPLDVVLIMALPRPKVFNRLLMTVTTMGVKDVYFINTRRVELCFWNSRVLKEKNMRRHLILGLEQAKDTLMPKIHLAKSFSSFIRNDLPCIKPSSSKYIAHPYSQRRIPQKLKKPAILMVGPEGGLLEREIDAFLQAGFKAFHLGQRILKVESIVPVLLSRFL